MNKKLEIKVGETYIYEPLRDEVRCTYLTPESSHAPTGQRMAEFVFVSKVAAFHTIPIVLPLERCDHYLAEVPQIAQA